MSDSGLISGRAEGRAAPRHELPADLMEGWSDGGGGWMGRACEGEQLVSCWVLGAMLCAGWTTKVPAGADPLGLPWVRTETTFWSTLP